MEINIPEQICDSHIIIGKFPRLEDYLSLEQVIKVIDKYKLDSILVFSSYYNPEKETDKILQFSCKNSKIYVLLRANPNKYLDSKYINYMERTIQENNQVVGVKINSSTERHTPIDSIYMNLLEMLNDNHAILLLHCGRWVEMSGWHYGIKVAEQYPNITVILAHMGGTHPDFAYPAIEASKNIKNIYMNTAQCRQIQVIEKAVKEMGSKRILFGSDMPWGNFLQNLVGVIEANISERDRNNILYKNFNKLIKGVES